MAVDRLHASRVGTRDAATSVCVAVFICCGSCVIGEHSARSLDDERVLVGDFASAVGCRNCFRESYAFLRASHAVSHSHRVGNRGSIIGVCALYSSLEGLLFNQVSAQANRQLPNLESAVQVTDLIRLFDVRIYLERGTFVTICTALQQPLRTI